MKGKYYIDVQQTINQQFEVTQLKKESEYFLAQ